MASKSTAKRFMLTRFPAREYTIDGQCEEGGVENETESDADTLRAVLAIYQRSDAVLTYI
jgi:hypothetical protein